MLISAYKCAHDGFNQTALKKSMFYVLISQSHGRKSMCLGM